MKKRRLMLCSIISLIMVFVMAVPMTVSADTVAKVKTAEALQAAVNAGGEIVLDDNITASITIPKDANVTLDLNGKTLTGGANDAIYVSLGATLTINDSVGNGSVKAATGGKAAVFNNGTTTIKNGYYTRSAGQWYTIVNHGTMTIENAKADASIDGTSSLIENGYSNYAKKDERAGYVAGTNAKNPELTIKDGTFVSSGYNAVKNDDGGILNINGGSFSAVRENGAVIQNWHHATITAGKFTAKGESGTISIGAYNTGVNDGVTTISGGTFSAEKNAVFAAGVGGNAKGKLTVENGIFSGKMSSELMNSAYDTTFSGGEFTDDPGQYVVNDKAVLVLDKDEYLVIYNDDDYARVLGATYKAAISDTPYYYLDEEDAVGQGKLESLGHSVDFYAMQPEGSIDYEQGDSITVPNGNSVKEFLAIVNEKYEFDKKAYAITDPKAVDGYKFLGWYNGTAKWNENDDTKLDSFAYGEKFDFDQKITKDTEVFAAWEKVGSGSNEPTQPGNLDKPSKDNGAVAKADKSAKTGDDFNLFAVGGVALAAIIAMAAVAITGRRHRQR